MSQLDHLVVAAPTLASGVDYVRHALGVEPKGGGEHPRMGTHNRFVKLGERAYLEVIAINPDAPAPGRPRWFALDRGDPAPRLAGWVARTDDIHAAVAASPLPLGRVEAMSRGNLNWLISIPEDGSLPMQGVAPMLIQWPAGIHPADTMEESGCLLLYLACFHAQAQKVSQALEAIDYDGKYQVTPLPRGEAPRLVAHVQTPNGLIRLS
jgi:hypothetical protein